MRLVRKRLRFRAPLTLGALRDCLFPNTNCCGGAAGQASIMRRTIKAPMVADAPACVDSGNCCSGSAQAVKVRKQKLRGVQVVSTTCVTPGTDCCSVSVPCSSDPVPKRLYATILAPGCIFGGLTIPINHDSNSNGWHGCVDLSPALDLDSISVSLVCPTGDTKWDVEVHNGHDCAFLATLFVAQSFNIDETTEAPFSLTTTVSFAAGSGARCAGQTLTIVITEVHP